METTHRVYMEDARNMDHLDDASIDLMVTSPPYPMIQLWDDQFCASVPAVQDALAQGEGYEAFELMHRHLDGVWKEVSRVLKPGGIACINIGDATRTIDGHFQMFANHSRIITSFLSLGFSQLPAIIWRKPTNAPNKFMGSGMYPPGAYVTLEHEYILLFRKGAKRLFDDPAMKTRRRQSAYFWEERNIWFSDVWTDLRGASQHMTRKAGRSRSAAFPLELPFRIINMFSVLGDHVLDPFLGTGTTLQAAMCAGRHSAGFESDPHFLPIVLENITRVPEMANTIVQDRLHNHHDFIQMRIKSNKDPKHQNRNYGFAVMTRQEEDLLLYRVDNLQYLSDHHFRVTYSGLHGELAHQSDAPAVASGEPVHVPTAKGRQMKLF